VALFQESIKVDQQPTTIEDAILAIEIFKKALEYRPRIVSAIVGEEYRALSNEARIQEMLQPRVGTIYADEKKTIPALFFRFVGDESPIVEAYFYPYEAILSFLAEARSFAQWIRRPEADDAEVERNAFELSVEMTVMMIDHFYPRGRLMMDSFVWEVIVQWRLQNEQRAQQYRAGQGEIVPKRKNKALDNAIEVYAKEIVGLWRWQGQNLENVQKLQLAEDYDDIYQHWKRLSKIAGDKDWLEYAKPNKFHDTPDDLLERLPDIDRRDDKTTEDRLSALALEHAARRAGLIKKHGVSPSIIDLRKKGIKATGYSVGLLFDYLKQGRELAEHLKEQEKLSAQEKEGVLPEQVRDSGQMEKAKSLEQKISFIQTEKEKPTDESGDSAQGENAPK
jgi:hypothetical protein